MTDAQVRLAATIGVSPREMGALALAYATGGAGTADVRRRLGLSAAATTELVDRLEGSGHVIRSRSTSDRRAVHITLSPTTSAAIARALDPLLTGLQTVLDALDADQRQAVDQFLAHVTDRYRSYAATAHPMKEPA